MDTAQFLARVVAPGNYLAICCKAPGKPMWSRFFPRDAVDDVAAFVRWADGKNMDVWHALGSYRLAESKLDKHGNSYFQGRRTQDNVDKLQCFWYDADVRRPGDGKDPSRCFATLDDVRQWVAGLTDFVPPNLWIKSGYGVHLYWVLDRPLGRDQWQPLAERFKAALMRNQARGDIGISGDAARILRPPNTRNHKVPTQPAAVLTLHEAASYPADKFAALLQHFEPVQTTPRPAGSTSPLPGGGPAVAFAGLGAGLAVAAQAGITPARRPHYMALIAQHCPQVATSLAAGGAGDSRDLWYLGNLSLATGCVDGDDYAHRLSAGGPNYSRASLDALIAQVRDEIAQKAIGYPSCSKYNTYRRGVCESCPHWGRIKSPLSLGVENFDMPAGYRRYGGWVEYQVSDKDGNSEWVPLFESMALNPELVKTPEGYRLDFTHTHKDRKSFNTDTIPTDPYLAKHFASKHIVLHPEEAKMARRFIVEWIKHLQPIMSVNDPIEPGTWTDIGFAVGDRLYQPNGTVRPIACSPEMTTDFAVVGRQEAWTQVVNTIIARRPDGQIIVAAGFAAPLVAIGGYNGGLIGSAYGPSGVAKSTLAAAGQTIWTKWRHNHIKLHDTQNAIMHRFASWHQMPFYIDELVADGDEGRRQLVSLLFDISEGSDKRRLDRNAMARKTGGWESLCMATTNEPLIEAVIHETKNKTDAGALRMFSFEITSSYTGATDTTISNKLEDNRGSAGAVYAAWLASHREDVKQDYYRFTAAIQSELKPEGGERFYIGFITCIMLGAVYAKRLGLVDFDTNSMLQFLYDAYYRLRGQRQDEITLGMQPVEILNKYLSEHQLDTLVTDVLPNKFTNNKVTPHAIRRPGLTAKRIDIQIAVDDQLLRINHAACSSWCVKNRIPWTTFKQHITDHWRGVVRASSVIGKYNNTHPPGAYTARCIELDLGHPELAHILDNARRFDPPPGGKAPAMARPPQERAPSS